MDGRNWKKCPNGHVLGEIVREIVQHNGRRAYATRLRVFQSAMETAPGELELTPRTIAVLEGTAPEVRCTICNASVPWVIGQAEIDRLVARWATRRAGL
jgi:hypothetical protein